MKLDVVEIRVSHWEEMVAWYQHTLGLKLIAREDDDQFALLSVEDGATIGLWGAGKKSTRGTCAHSLHWRVDNVDLAVDELSGRGITFPKRIEQRHWGRVAEFHDPEGNKHFLYQEKPS